MELTLSTLSNDTEELIEEMTGRAIRSYSISKLNYVVPY